MGELSWGEARGGVTCFGSFFLPMYIQYLITIITSN